MFDVLHFYHCSSSTVPNRNRCKNRGGFWLELGGFPVHIGTEADFDRTKTKVHIAYEVNDLEEWRGKLAHRGIKILDGVPIPDYSRFEFRDPFGNRVEFLEKL